MSEALERLLAQLPDGPMKDALRAQDDDFAEEMLLDYFDATDAEKRDIRAFFLSDGPVVIEEHHQEIQRDEDGTPTARDLEKWL